MVVGEQGAMRVGVNGHQKSRTNVITGCLGSRESLLATVFQLRSGTVPERE